MCTFLGTRLGIRNWDLSDYIGEEATYDSQTDNLS